VRMSQRSLKDIYLFIDCRFPFFFFFTCRTTEIACLLGVCLYNTVTINNPSGVVQLDALIDIDRISGSCNKIEYNTGPTRLVSLLLLMLSITDFLTNRTVACWLDAWLHSAFILFIFCPPVLLAQLLSTREAQRISEPFYFFHFYESCINNEFMILSCCS
jgi:hypothetical protein